jgi:hypothetical protein
VSPETNNLSPAARILAVIVSQPKAMFASSPLDMCEPLQLGLVLGQPGRERGAVSEAVRRLARPSRLGQASASWEMGSLGEADRMGASCCDRGTL